MRAAQVENVHIDSSFVLGFTEAELVWSAIQNVLYIAFLRMIPPLFDATVFLKVNRDYWDDLLVSRAAHKNISEKLNYVFNNIGFVKK